MLGLLNSLAGRSFAASLLLLPLLLLFSGAMLDSAYRRSLNQAEHDSLLAQCYAMMGAAEPSGSSLSLPPALPDPRFSTPDSGLYAQVIDADQRLVWQSPSLAISAVRPPPLAREISAGETDFRALAIDGDNFARLVFTTVWELEGSDRQFRFVVLHSLQAQEREIRGYRQRLLLWLGGMALLLLLVQAAVIRWGLAPLQRLTRDIGALEAGRIKQLDHNYPREIVPLTTSINQLLASEQRQQQRYKNTLGDLAHSLKTPLAVIRSLLNKVAGGEKPAIDEQVERMAAIINHQLARASSATRATFQSSIALAPIFERLGAALSKVYRDKQIILTNQIEPTQQLALSEEDAMELFGNLLENAYKYGRSQVRVSAAENAGGLTVFIDDDGDGVADALRSQVLHRGARADTATSGQGIGLAVASDIVSAYSGGLSIASSPFGGARVQVELPGA